MTTHDYIGLGEATSADKVSSSASAGGSSTLTTSASEEGRLKYKETELRLGLPGSESPERKLEKGGGGDGGGGGYGGVVLKSFMSGAKRGFSDAIDGHGKWGFPGGGGVGEVEVGKGGALFSPRGGRSPAGVDGIVQQQGLVGANVAKEVGSLAAKPAQEKKPQISAASDHAAAPASKAQVVGWPPIRSFRKNTMASNSTKDSEDADNSLYVKVSMDGAPYLRKVSLKTYSNYKELSSALEKMFSCFTIGQFGSHGAPGRDGLSERRLKDLLHGSEYVLTYEDKDGDWMLVGDVPWEMFIDSCKRLRIMMGTEAIGLAPRAMEKCKNRN